MDRYSTTNKKQKANLEIVQSIPESVFICFSHPWPWPQCVWHYHCEYEIHLILNASGQVWVGDYIGPFRHGHLVLVGPDLPHNWTSNSLGSSEAPMQEDHVIQFRYDSLGAEFFNVPDLIEIRELLNVARRGVEFVDYPDELTEKIVNISGLHGVERVVLLLQILKAMSDSRKKILCSERYSPILGDASAKKINKIISFMRDNLKEDLTLEEAASLIHMQPRSFSRFFRQITGRRFSDYLCEMRVGEACDLLQNTDISVTDICFSVGFNNISWFNRCFMDSKKVTPREYRRSALGRYGFSEFQDRMHGQS